MIPDETTLEGTPFRRKFTTDGQYFYDSTGGRRTAPDYKSSVEAALKESASALPLTVHGQVHWSAVRIDNKHIRVTLVDPGYYDPADRDAEIATQHVAATSCTDILSRESLPLHEGKVRLRVPAGAVRIVDITHQ
jgi:hypothetical protein